MPCGKKDHQQPGRQKGQTAERGDHAQPSGIGNGQQLETAGKQQDAGKHQPAGPAQQFRTWPMKLQHGDQHQPQRMPHLVIDGGFVDRQHLRREQRFQAMGAECPHRDAKQGAKRAEQQKYRFHASFSLGINCTRLQGRVR